VNTTTDHTLWSDGFIIPAIDLIDGKCVRLTQGDYTRQIVYNTDPVAVAQAFEAAGVKRLHLVDLDGAKAGAVQNLGVLEAIARTTKLVIDFGGGIKTRDTAQSVLDAGAAMVTIGSLAVKSPDTVAEWVVQLGAQKILIGADVEQEQIRISGWLEDGGTDIYTFIAQMRALGLQQFFCTDIAKDGMMQGSSLPLYQKLLQRFPDLQLIASGGVHQMEEVIALREAGCAGAIIGKALYEGTIALPSKQDAL
jgi:phosphoribosylformimino-5-aminoimidazole carboxamide ribotide isomerase